MTLASQIYNFVDFFYHQPKAFGNLSFILVMYRDSCRRVEQLVAVAMMMAPKQRLYYHHFLRPLVYGAVVGPVPD
jgi:hypothetical protein